jgi:hypothetical protein
MNTMGLDLCMRLGQAGVNQVAAMILSRVAIQPVQVLGGDLRFGTPQLVRATCPNSLEFDVPFAFNGFVSANGTIRLMAQVTAMPMNGTTRVCLRNFGVTAISIPSAPGLESVAMGLVAQFLPPEICVDLPSMTLGL